MSKEKFIINIPEEFNLKDIKSKKLEKIHNEAIEKYLKAKNIKELDEIILTLNRIVSSDKENINAIYNLAILYSDIKNFDKSIELFEKCVEILNNDKKNTLYESSLYNLANQYIFKKDFSKALEIFESILENNLKSWDTLYNAGYICMNYIKDYNKAIEYFDTLFRFGSIDKNTIYNLGISYKFNDNSSKAIDTFEYLMKLIPEFSPTYYNLGDLYNRIEQKDKSYFYYEKFVNMPKSTNTEYNFIKIAKRRMKEFENKK